MSDYELPAEISTSDASPELASLQKVVEPTRLERAKALMKRAAHDWVEPATSPEARELTEYRALLAALALAQESKEKRVTARRIASIIESAVYVVSVTDNRAPETIVWPDEARVDDLQTLTFGSIENGEGQRITSNEIETNYLDLIDAIESGTFVFRP